MTVPIELRGQPIGQIVMEDDQPQRQLSADERELVQEVVQRMALALESTRLFEQTQSALGEARRLAQRERYQPHHSPVARRDHRRRSVTHGRR